SPAGADEGPVRPDEAERAEPPVLAPVRTRGAAGPPVEPVARLGLPVRRQRQPDHQPAGLPDQQPPHLKRCGRRGLCRPSERRRTLYGPGGRHPDGARRQGRRLAALRLRALDRQHPRGDRRRPVRRRRRQSGLGRLPEEDRRPGRRSGDQGPPAGLGPHGPDRPLQARLRHGSGGARPGADPGRQRRGRLAPAAGR
ncbi:hypothetical protein LTR94_030884, partial [Friedmanniomyces endolithicus]